MNGDSQAKIDTDLFTTSLTLIPIQWKSNGQRGVGL